MLLKRNNQGIPVDDKGQALLDGEGLLIPGRGQPVIEKDNRLLLACYYDPAGNFPRQPYTAKKP